MELSPIVLDILFACVAARNPDARASTGNNEAAREIIVRILIGRSGVRICRKCILKRLAYVYSRYPFVGMEKTSAKSTKLLQGSHAEKQGAGVRGL